MTTPIVIIGTGFSGLGLAIQLKLSGRDDFILLERASTVGGTWRDNTYPGCACDVQSHLYSFSFAPNPNWSKVFSPQPEILTYLKECAEKFDLGRHIRFNCNVERMQWDEKSSHWNIETSQGPIQAQSVAMAVGPLSEPAFPSIPGLETFRGKKFHSARWDRTFDPQGLRVAVIGTGASAVQFVPILQKQVRRLISFQRTAAWVVPLPNRRFRNIERRLFSRFPLAQKVQRSWIFWAREIFSSFFRYPKLMRIIEVYSLYRLKRDVGDRSLREKLTPNFTIGCKRILLSDTYWKSLAESNVEVVTDAVVRVERDAVITASGRYEVDALIMATGFRVTDSAFYKLVFGRNGQSLADVWAGSPRAYLGTSLHGFPNLFFLLGPNTGLGHTSVVLMVEAQVEHVLKVLRRVRDAVLTSVEPDSSAESAFVSHVDHAMKPTVWALGGCKSWYMDKTGRNSAIWPKSVVSYQNLIHAAGLEGYQETKG